jgi:hypothetical protein
MLKHVLKSYLNGDISELDVELWANLVESREDISATPIVRQAIFELANPDLEGKLTHETAERLIGRLKS